MIFNYFKISIRNLKNRLPYTLVNVIGLSIGLSCFLILISYTRYEENYDDFQENKSRLYRVIFERYQGGELISASPGAMPAFGNRIKDEIAEIKEMSRFCGGDGNIVKNERVTAEEDKLVYADVDFFKMFSFNLLAGNPATVLENPNSIVLTESMALKYFGKEDPLNKELEVANEFGNKKYNITGIVKDPPLNTSFDFDFLCSFNSIYRGKKWFENSWMYWSFPTFLSISNKSDLEQVKSQFPEFIKKYKTNPMEEDLTWKFSLQPIQDIHLKSNFGDGAYGRNSGATTLSLLKIIAILILIISWVNYINLATASSTERAKEIGIRKSIGAKKSQISAQFLIEAALVNSMAVLFSVIIVFLVIKPFSTLLGLNYSTEIVLRPMFWLSLFPIVIIGTIASGLYPAFVLASFNPTDVLKSKTMGITGSASVRKVLVGVQFVISILLIACTAVMIHQNNFMKNKDLGVDINDVIVIRKPQLIEKVDYKSSLNSFKNELKKATKAKYVSASWGVPSISSWGLAVWKISEGVNTQQVHTANGVDANYINVYGLKLLAGRNFVEHRIADKNSIIISKKSLEILGIEKPEDAIGVKLGMENFNKRQLEIIGVIDDYHHYSLQSRIGGMVLIPNIKMYSSPRNFSLKLASTNQSIQSTIKDAENIYKRFFPKDIFQYFILKDRFQLAYITEDRNQNVFSIFSFIAIFLACIGILGLSSFIALLKTRNIAIRKVLGADNYKILWILSKEFLVVLLGASVIAVPIAIYFMIDWLAGYPYHISLSFWHFSLAVFAIFLITLMVIIFNLYKSLRKSPMTILRTE